MYRTAAELPPEILVELEDTPEPRKTYFDVVIAGFATATAAAFIFHLIIGSPSLQWLVALAAAIGFTAGVAAKQKGL